MVFDEAHNLCKVLESACSWEIDFMEFEKIIKDIEYFFDIVYNKKSMGKNSDDINEICNILV